MYGQTNPGICRKINLWKYSAGIILVLALSIYCGRNTVFAEEERDYSEDLSGIEMRDVPDEHSDMETYDYANETLTEETQAVLSDTSRLTVSIMGDSVSTYAGYISSEYGIGYYYNLLMSVTDTWWMKYLTSNNMRLGVNESRGGTNITFLGANDRFDADACMSSQYRIEKLDDNGTPDVILFFGGLNDACAEVPLGTFDGTQPIGENTTFAGAYRTTIASMQALYPEARIIAMIPYYVWQHTQANADRYAKMTADICDYYGVEYVDLRDCGIGIGPGEDMLSPDGIHPTSQGMTKIYNKLQATLNENTILKTPYMTNTGTKLNWSVIDGAQSYEIYTSTSPYTGFHYYSVSQSNYYPVSALAGGEAYYKVRAVGVNAVSNMSDVVSVDIVEGVAGTNIVGLCVQNQGRSINIGAGYTTTAGELQFQWQVYNIATSQWTIISDWQTGNWITWVPEMAGTYWIHVTSRDEIGRENVYTCGYVVEDNTLLLNGICAIDRGNTIDMGVAYTSDDLAVEFRWQIYDLQSQTWSEVRDWSEGNWASWRLKSSGTYWLHVEARDSMRTVRTYTIGYVASKCNVELYGICFQDAPSGKNMGIAYRINDSNVEFRWKVYSTRKKQWQTISDWEKGNWIYWNIRQSGKYQICVDARNGKKEIVNSYTMYYTVDGPDIYSLFSQSSSPSQINEKVTFQAQIKDPLHEVSSCGYAIYSMNSWCSLESNGMEAVWKPDSVGIYTIRCIARDIDGNILAVKDIVHNVENPFVRMDTLEGTQISRFEFLYQTHIYTNDRKATYDWKYYDCSTGEWYTIQTGGTLPTICWVAPKPGLYWIQAVAYTSTGVTCANGVKTVGLSVL